MTFGGTTYEPILDEARLTTQLQKVRAAMLGGSWFTLGELQKLCGGSEAGISARIRDLRRKEHGGYIIERERMDDPKRGIFHYRLRIPEPLQRTLFE